MLNGADYFTSSQIINANAVFNCGLRSYKQLGWYILSIFSNRSTSLASSLSFIYFSNKKQFHWIRVFTPYVLIVSIMFYSSKSNINCICIENLRFKEFVSLYFRRKIRYQLRIKILEHLGEIQISDNNFVHLQFIFVMIFYDKYKLDTIFIIIIRKKCIARKQKFCNE